MDDILKTLAGGVEAAEAMVVFNDAYHGKKDPAHAKLAADFRAMTDKVNEGAKQVLADTRMPKAESTSAKLLKIATDTLKDPKYGVGKYRRMVINNDLYSREEEKAMPRTNIELDDHLVDEAMRLTGARTKREVVDIALVNANTGAFEGVAVRSKTAGNGVRLFEQSGRFYFRVDASMMNWKIKVLQLTPDEAERYKPKTGGSLLDR